MIDLTKAVRFILAVFNLQANRTGKSILQICRYHKMKNKSIGRYNRLDSNYLLRNNYPKNLTSYFLNIYDIAELISKIKIITKNH